MWGPRIDWECVSVCLLAFAVYINTFNHGFVYDDNRAILTNPDVKAYTSFFQVFQNDFWGTPLSSSNSHGSYRPLCVLSFRLNHWISGYRPSGFHLTNTLLHAVASALVLITSRVLLPGRAPLLAAALFAVHPVHVEAVAGVVGRADVLASIFFLSSFLLYVEHMKVRDSAVLLKFSSRNEPLVKSCRTTNKSKKCDYSVFNNNRNGYNLNRSLKLFLLPREGRTYFALFLVFAVCAVLSKEPGITVIPLAICYDIILHLRSKKLVMFKPQITTSASASLVYFLVICMARLYIMGLQSPSFSKADNPTAKETSTLTRTLTFFYLPIFNLLLLVWPQWLSFDWSMDAIPRITSLLDYRFFLSVCFYFTLYRTTKLSFNKLSNQPAQNPYRTQICKACPKHSVEEHLNNCRVINNNNLPVDCNCKNPSFLPLPKELAVTVCLSFMVFPFLPASNLFFYVGFVVAERVLYIPSIGFCMMVALGAHGLWSRQKHFVAKVGLALLLCLFATRTLQRNSDWSSEEHLYRSAIHINPPKAYGNLGSVLSTAGRLEEAETALRLALDHRPNMADVHFNLANLFNKQSKYQDAIASYQHAIHYRPSLAVAHLNLGQTLQALDRWPEAEAAYRKCSLLDVSGLKDPRSHEGARTSCVQKLKSMCENRECLAESLAVIRDAKSKRTIVTMDSVNEYGTASPSLQRRVRGANKTRASEEEDLFIKALQKAPSDPSVYINYGQLLVHLGRLSEAASMYVRAAQLAPRQHTLVQSAAVALRQANRLAEAEALYKQARDIRPQDATSHSNLGAIFHLQGKYRQAASSYKEALKLSPDDQVTLSNLQKLRNIMSRNKR